MANFAPYAFAFECGLIVVAAVVGWLFDHSPLATLDFSAEGRQHHVRAIGWGLAAALPPLAGVLLMERTPLPALRNLVTLVDQHVVPLFTESSILELALLAIAAGIGEEMLFRGVIQHGLETWWGEPDGVWLGLLVASVLFALGHALSTAYLVLAFGMSLYLGVLFHATGNLLTPVATHALYDFVALWYLVHRHRRPTPSTP